MPVKPIISYEEFARTDIRCGRILQAEIATGTHKPAIRLWIDFGEEIGIKKSSAQLTRHYSPESLIHRQVIAVVNFAPRQIGKFISEVLVLGLPDVDGHVVLLSPDFEVVPGGAMF